MALPRKIFISLLLFFAFMLNFSAVLPQQTGTPLIVRIYYHDQAGLNRLAAEIDIWEVHQAENYVLAMIWQADFKHYTALGYQIEIDAVKTAQINTPAQPLQNQRSGIPGYPCYRTVEETYAAAEALADAHPSLASWVDIGDSWDKTSANAAAGYDIFVLKLTNSAISGEKPVLFVMSAIHAREYATAELNLRFAEYLLDNYNSNADATWLLDAHEIHLVFQANPDGRKQAESGILWRKNCNGNYCSPTSSYRGADLNRNFPFQWGCCGGSSANPCDNTYRGPSAASEPETTAITTYVRSIFPDQRADDLTTAAPTDATGIFIDLHSYGGYVIWPWGYDYTAAPNATGLTTLGRKFAFLNGYYPDQATGIGYVSDGATDDFAYGDLGVAAYTFEVGTAFFQSCTYFGNTLLTPNLNALLYAAKAARTPYQTPGGPDILNLTASPSTADWGETITISASASDAHFSTRNGTEATQAIQAAQAYLDVPPWESGATPLPFTALDGNFNTTTENITLNLPATNLSPGRHTLYVRAQDASGSWGAVSALFITINYAQFLPAIMQ